MVIATPPIRQQFEALLLRYPDRRFELIDGEIVEEMPTPLHAVIAYLLSGHFFVFLRDHPLGWLLVEVRCLIGDDPDNDRVPDLSFVRRREGRVIPHDDPLPFAPDLVIEIQSPGQSDKFMLDKAQFYLRHGSQAVWLVYPRKRLVEALTPTDRHLLTIDDTLSGGDVLPGFALAVRDIFPAEL